LTSPWTFWMRFPAGHVDSQGEVRVWNFRQPVEMSGFWISRLKMGGIIYSFTRLLEKAHLHSLKNFSFPAFYQNENGQIESHGTPQENMNFPSSCQIAMGLFISGFKSGKSVLL